jgi:ribosome-binding protein aMBF1 (putative translation factor)
MEHQDWNNISFNNKSETKMREDAKKINSNKITNPEDFKIEAPKDLGKLIAQARTTKKKNQKELASELGINQQIISRWESNKEIPTNLQIANIEKKLGIKLPRTKKIKTPFEPA